MANSFSYNDKKFNIGDTVKLTYRIIEGEKTRSQLFEGILLKVKGDSFENRMITIRKMSKTGIGVERILPLSSPNIQGIDVVKKTSYTKAKLYFTRTLSEQKIKHKIYKKK